MNGVTRARAAFLVLLLAFTSAACVLPSLATATPGPTITPQPTPTARILATGKPITPTPTANATAAPTACTVANTGGEYLRLRAGPSLAAEVLAGLHPGQRLQLIGTPGGAWLHVQTAAGVSGYVSSDFCEVKQ